MPENYCCSRFQESVAEGKIEHVKDAIDETEWYLTEWLHVYYCPFCGSFIKGEGYGTYHEETGKNICAKEA